MNRKLCLLFLVCLAVVLVKSESSIEIDENGDEYEVKRFNIQGRQLNEGRSQCVVSRRKRAAQPKPLYSDDGSNDEVDDKDEEQQAVLYYSPPMVNPIGDDNDEDANEGDESAMNMNEMNKEGGDETMEEQNKNSSEEMNADENEDYNGEDDTIKVIQLPQLPILGQLQSDGETLAAIIPASGSADKVGANGIVVVQSHTPPKVNPQTHAIFELVPVNHAGHDKDDDDDDDDFDFEEDIDPVTTTAIWSTGDDNGNINYDDLDNKPVRPQKLIKKVKKPLKANKKEKKKKPALKPKRKNKYNNNNNKRPLISGNKKRRNNKNRPYRTSVRRPTKKNKFRRGYTTRHGRPQRNRYQAIRKPSSSQNKNTFKNKLIAKKQNQKQNSNVIDQGSDTFTRTMTMTQTGDEAGDKNVNCIIIRRDEPTTTPRPFWNILGRSANGSPKASGHYGQRKRVNVRFVA